MIKQCRIAITQKCNRSCDYCCMKNPDIFGQFTQLKDFSELPDLSQYFSFAITGGEPLCAPERLNEVLEILRPTYQPVYLFTNGTLLNPENLMAIRSRIAGMNIGLHEESDVFLEQVKAIKSLAPCRLFVEDIKMNNRLLQFSHENSIMLRVWTKDKCETAMPEDKFLILGE